jgi:hypothetical protein
MTEQKRQQVRDFLALAEKLGGEELKQKAWSILDYETKFEFNWEKTTPDS